MDYYDKYAEEFFKKTVNADMSILYIKFLNLIPEKSHILDAGCGSGRDTLEFLKKGYKVTSIDASGEMCKIAAKHTNHLIIQKKFQEIDYHNEFDGIWASASLLHIASKELDLVLENLYKSLKKGGIIYASFKYGNYEGIRNGRYFNDLSEDDAKNIFEKNNFRINDMWISSDVRKGREEEKWLNIIAKRNE